MCTCSNNLTTKHTVQLLLQLVLTVASEKDVATRTVLVTIPGQHGVPFNTFGSADASACKREENRYSNNKHYNRMSITDTINWN